MRDKIAIGSEAEARAVLGVQDRHARLFRNEYGVAVTVRNGELHLSPIARYFRTLPIQCDR